MDTAKISAKTLEEAQKWRLLEKHGVLTGQNKARYLVFSYAIANLGAGIMSPNFSMDDVIVVWHCKTLQNSKTLVTTTLPDSRYYEVTHDGDKRKTYLDVYSKSDQVVVPN